jgi:penicillin-binding protein 1C
MKFVEWIKKFISKYRKILVKTAVIAAAVLTVFTALNLIFPLPLYRIEDDFSTLHIDSDNKLIRITLSGSGRYRIKMGLSGMPEYVKKGFVEYEDRSFYYNPGINPAAIVRAMYLNIKKGRVVSGGSTITLQIAKLIEPKKKRTFLVKVIEAFRALQLTMKYSKDRLLEIYLNTIPMGGNIEGVAAASYFYFNKPPSGLSLGEAATLIALPKQPNRLRPDIRLKEAYDARDAVLKRIAPGLKLGGDILSMASEEKYPGRRFINPGRLQHLVNRKFAGTGYIRNYFINNSVQDACEYRLKKTIDRLKKKGVYNGAIIVAENRTGRVIAYAGSPDFGDKAHGGEIDGANIYRSPGSTLKPLLYGLALDAGIITPKKIVYDIPRDYDGYYPVNAQKKFNGMITAEEALTHSYNSIAVMLENELAGRGLLYTLKKSGFTDIKRNNITPGLSVVLGTYPMTLEELVTIYSAIANGGELKRLKYTVEQEKIKEDPVRILSGESSYIVSEMLAKGERPDLPQSWEFTYYRGKVAFKTGTSFGMIDALCVGYNPDYTVGVWLGNADCSPSFELIGIKSAAPLLMEIFNVLTKHTDTWFTAPDGVASRKVCPASGDLPGDFCRDTTDDMYIKGRTRNVTCRVHKQIFINKKTGLRADPGHLKYPLSCYEKRTIEEWPPEAASFLRQNGGMTSLIPPYSVDEAPDGSYARPKITSPVNGNIYMINSAMPVEYQRIPLKVAAAGGTENKIFWFANGRVIASGSADKTLFFKPEPGTYEIAVQDNLGESDKVNFKVFEEQK